MNVFQPEDKRKETRFNVFLDTQRSDSDKKHLKKLLKAQKAICSKVLHKVFSLHVVDNVFFKLNFGPNPRGIFGATPCDLMHAFEEGLVPNFLDVVIGPLPAEEQEKLDEIASAFFEGNNNRGSGKTNYPRVTFSGRFTSLSLLSVDEKMGKLLLLYLISKTDKGMEVLTNSCESGFDLKKKIRRKRFKGIVDDDDDDEEERHNVTECFKAKAYALQLIQSLSLLISAFLQVDDRRSADRVILDPFRAALV